MSIQQTPAQIREHYKLERELAEQLRNATPTERLKLYGPLYDELFRKLPHHPQLQQKRSPAAGQRHVNEQMAMLQPFLTPSAVFLEIGPGDCALSIAACAHVRHVYAVDVSNVIAEQKAVPANLEFVLSDGVRVSVPEGSVAVAFSNQLIEHLHPDDALAQTQNVYRALRPGGAYVCVTPSRITGPHDISRHFDSRATGFHLKEYSIAELHDLMRRAGFVRFGQSGLIKGRRVEYPLRVTETLERTVDLLPHRLGRWIAQRLPLRLALNNFQLISYK